MAKRQAKVSMLGEASKVIGEPSVLCRLLFAKSVLPDDTPKLWKILAQFSTYGSTTSLSPSQVELVAENLTFADQNCLSTDDSLQRELVSMPFEKSDQLGVVLVSSKKICMSCNAKLLVWADRPSNITLYTESHGTLTIENIVLILREAAVSCNTMAIAPRVPLY